MHSCSEKINSNQDTSVKQTFVTSHKEKERTKTTKIKFEQSLTETISGTVWLYVRVNEGNARQYMFDNTAEIMIASPGALYFYLRLNAGDRVDIVNGENPILYIGNNGASLYGFLIQKF